jgi:hypothetical protein
MAEVTVCPDCGATLDYRPLRPVDTGASGPADLPADEAAIQALAAIKKAEEVREESGEMDALPLVELNAHPSEEEVIESLESKEALVAPKIPDEVKRVNEQFAPSSAVGACEKQGGELVECDEGKGKANRCTNSKWGKAGAFAGPCACPCHAWPPGQGPVSPNK